jgi:hypothetical protein
MVVGLVWAEDARSRVPDGFLGIRSVFMFIGVVLGQSLPFYGLVMVSALVR